MLVANDDSLVILLPQIHALLQIILALAVLNNYPHQYESSHERDNHQQAKQNHVKKVKSLIIEAKICAYFSPHELCRDEPY